MGGRGSASRLTPSNLSNVSDWQEAFDPGVDYEASGDVDHVSRTVTRSLQHRWDAFTQRYSDLTQQEENDIMKDWDWNTGELYGYVRTTNSFKINEKLYDPKNAGKTDSQIFTRRDRKGRRRDLDTVRTLDKAINGHTTERNAIYTRFCSPGAIRATFGLDASQMAALANAQNLSTSGMRALNGAFKNLQSFSNAYTSTSANRSMNAFKNPKAPQSRGFVFERKIYVPQGTNAYSPRKNAQESEVIFGRKMQTKIMKIEVSNDGHIVLHEMFDGYK